MPQNLEQLLLQKHQAPNVQLPAQGKQTWLDPILQGVDTALGLERQQPGNLAGAIGAAAGTLFPSVAKILQFKQRVPNPESLEELTQFVKQSPRMREFQPMPEAGTFNEVPPEEINKVIDLSKPRPWLERKK